MSSATNLTFLSDSQVHMDSESKTTTPSATPQRASNSANSNKSCAINDAAHVPEVERPRSPHESDVDSHEDNDDHEGDDNGSVNPEDMNLAMRRRLRYIGRNWRRRNMGFLPRQQPPQLSYDQLNVKALRDHHSMMKWISDLFEEVPSSASSDLSEDLGRTKCVPKLTFLHWRQWSPHLTPPGGHPIYGDDDVPHALYCMKEDAHIGSERVLEPRFQEPSSAGATQSARPPGVEYLPSQLRIHSLAIRRFVGECTEGKLSSGTRNGYMTLYRPFKLLVHIEDSLREHREFLGSLLAEAAKTMEKASAGDGGDGTNQSAEVDAKQAVYNPDMHEASNTNSIQEKASTLPPPPPLTENMLFTRGNWNRLDHEELQEAHAEFGLLVDFMDKYIFPLRKALRSMDDMQVHFTDLWHLYTPGSIVYVKDPGVPQKLWRVIQGTGGAWSPLRLAAPSSQVDYLKLGGSASGARLSPLTLDCYYVDFNGTHFVRVLKKFDVEEFKDLVSIKGLPILPLHVAEHEGFFHTERIEQRGLDFVSYTQWRYCYYRGRSLPYEPEGSKLRRPETGTVGSVSVLSESIESPVVVDFERCLQTIPNWGPCRNLQELSVPNKDALPASIGMDDDRIWDLRMAEKVLNYTDQSQTLEWNSRSPPTGDEILLLPNRVFAYILRTRKWACLPLGKWESDLDSYSLTRMEPELSAWENLQIDHKHRSIIQSMMATHFRKKKTERRQFDLIQDKGKGLIILLHGVPGVGKTSTAETVAQYYNKPLLPITCGDLGMTPMEVESNLQSSFQLAQSWDCVLLLDEADVFLAERSQDNIARNALVSVFLRVMEYYEGILFLTTNKVGSFDEAFKSRMSLALYYPPLSQDQTEKIWDVQMKRTERLSMEAAPDDESQHVKFNRLDIMSLAKDLWMMQRSRDEWKPVWNGRQIRNAFQTAVALAEWHQQEEKISGPIQVLREHFEKVAFVSNEFNAYLYTVKHGRSDDLLSHKNEFRADQFDRSSQISWGGLGYVPQQQYQQPQHQQAGFGGWGNLQSSNLMGGLGQAGVMMGGSGLGNNNFQAQAGFGNPLQSGFGAIGNQAPGAVGMVSGSLNNPGAGNPGTNNYTIGGQGIGNPGMSNQGSGNPNMGNQVIGNQGMGNQSMGSGIQTGSINPQGMSGQNVPRQMMGQQQ